MSDDHEADDGWLEEEGMETAERETMVVNPTSVRERIDSTLEALRQAMDATLIETDVLAVT